MVPGPPVELLPCGDGTLDQGEVCDDGPDNGLANHCDFACGFVCTGHCPLRVDVDAAPGGDGSSWARAFDSVQAAIDGVGDCASAEFWVAEGVYFEDAATPVVSFNRGVHLYGGFAGDETLRDQRDWVAHPSVLGQAGMTTSVVVIQTIEGVTTSIDVDGFEITGGAAEFGGGIRIFSEGFDSFYPELVLANLWVHHNQAELAGGGLFSVAGPMNLKVRGSRFEANQATDGGAIGFSNVKSTLEGCEFVGNHASGSGGALLAANLEGENEEYNLYQVFSSEFIDNVADGGGGALAGGESNYFEDCRFEGNLALSGNGGAAAVREFSSHRSTFLDNHAALGGGAIHAWMAASYDSVFVDNSAGTDGGAVAMANANESFEFPNCVFIQNSAGGDGGAVWKQSLFGSPLFNATFIRNDAGGGGGAVWGHAVYQHCSFYDNQASAGEHIGGIAFTGASFEGVVAWPQPVFTFPDIPADGSIMHDSCIQDGDPGQISNLVFLTENPFVEIDVDLDGTPELYLDPASPCVDLGAIAPTLADSTTQAGQCVDVAPFDAGAHWTPLFDAGVCP